jgi:hypothetical protein
MACAVDGRMTFVICSNQCEPRLFDNLSSVACEKCFSLITLRVFEILLGEVIMTRSSKKTLLLASALIALTTSAFAQATAPTPWVLTPDMGYGYNKDGKTLAYKMGTDNAKVLLKGAKKVPKGTLFFIGQNGQLYMRSGPYLSDDGKFLFGPG